MYRGSVRQAVCEVEEALVNLQSTAVRGIDAQTAVDGCRASFNGTDALYKNGLASLVELEDARRTLLTAQTTLASLQQTRNTAWVSLYRAMLVEYAIVARRGHDGSGGLPAAVLSQLVIPSVYSYLDDLDHGIKRMWGKLRRQPKSAEPGAEPLPLA